MSRDNVTDLPDRDQLDADDRLLDHLGSDHDDPDPRAQLLRDIAIGGTR